MKKPRRLFRDRRRPDDEPDRRRVEYAGPPTVEYPDLSEVLDLARHVVIVPVHTHVEQDTYHCLRGLEDLGIRVDYSKGSSAIDLTRSLLASQALREGFESIMWIDADMMFDPADVVRLLLRPEPLVAGAYAAKKLGNGQINASFFRHQKEIALGEDQPTIAVKRIGAGFMRVRCSLLRKMVDELKLPLVRMAHDWGWPFYQPMIVDDDDGSGNQGYLTEDYAFCQRALDVGVDVLLDPSFRLYHLGGYAFGWEEGVGHYLKRYSKVEIALTRESPPRPEGY